MSAHQLPGPFDLRGKVAVVTGASSGIGRHFAAVLARAGVGVAAAARRRDALQSSVEELRSEGLTAIACELDVTAAASVDNAFDAVEAALGPVDILVNNAGIALSGSAIELDEAAFDRTLDTNLKGAWLMSRAFARRAGAAERGGAIVNIASILGLRVAGHVAAYAASKAGLLRLTEAMALELARRSIRVNAIAPGYIETALTADFLASDAGRAMVSRVPQRRFGQPADLDGALLLLCSDASSYMTGSTIVVDGGHLVSSL